MNISSVISVGGLDYLLSWECEQGSWKKSQFGPGLPNELDRSKCAVNFVEWPSASATAVGISGILGNEESSML
jgi:hypothetical protein